VLPLEGQRRALRVVLVVGPARARGVRELRELPLQRGHPLPRADPLGQQQLARVTHPPDPNRGSSSGNSRATTATGAASGGRAAGLASRCRYCAISARITSAIPAISSGVR